MAGGSILNTWQFAFQYGGLKKTLTHNKNKTHFQTVILLGCIVVKKSWGGVGVGELAWKFLLGRLRAASFSSAWFMLICTLIVPGTMVPDMGTGETGSRL
jgi:hypothetical protein